MPAEVSLETLLLAPARDDVSRLRLSRALVQLAKATATLTPLTAAAALHELASARLMRCLQRDRESGRYVLLQVGGCRHRVGDGGVGHGGHERLRDGA